MSSWRNSREYRIWRAIVIRRDKVCVICSNREGRHAHHIESAAYNVDLRFDPENGACLCSRCHIEYHTNFNRSYRIKTTRYNFENFKSLMKYASKIFNKGY